MKEFVFIWSVENISHSWHREGERLSSPKFLASSFQNTAWTLVLYPRGCNNSSFMSLYLRREEDDGPVKLAIDFELSCVFSDISLRSFVYRETGTTFAHKDESGQPCFLKRSDVFGRRKSVCLPRGVLTIRLRMRGDAGSVKEIEQSFGRTQLQIERIRSIENIIPKRLSEKTVHIHSRRQNKTLMSIRVVYLGDELLVEVIPVSVQQMKFFECKLSLVDKRSDSKLCGLDYGWVGTPRQETWQLPVSRNVLDTENILEFVSEFVYSTTAKQSMVLEKWTKEIPQLLSKSIGLVPSAKFTHHLTLYDDLSYLYLTQQFCDVELKTKTTSRLAHKTVLCARSPVFLAMLTSDLKEKRDGRIDIDDLTDDVLNFFLAFIYHDVFAHSSLDTVTQLYYASDKYQVERLKLFCCSYFVENMNVDNVCELLMLADRHYDCDLKRTINEFIWRNDKKVFMSPAWKKLAGEEQFLALSTMLSKYEERDNSSSTKSYADRLQKHPCLRDNMRSLYQEHLVSDIVIKTANGTFPAHKTVLCASSAAFKKVFATEEPTDSLEMTEFGDDTVSRLLLFLYTDSLEVPWDSAVELYRAAHVYQIYRLQIRCSRFFLENLRVSKASDLLLLAHEHRDDQLQSVVEDFILLHDDEVFVSDEWDKMAEANIHLAFETMCEIYRKTTDGSVL